MTRPVRPSLRRCLVVTSTTSLLTALVLAGPAGAATAVSVIDRETVKTTLDSSGKVQSTKLLEQITLLGNGKATILDPTSGKGVRDLDGFSPPKVTGGVARYEVDVNGREDLRTISDFTGALPVTVKAAYQLDGRDISAEDLVGKSGKLRTSYTVTNTTGTPTEVTYNNAIGQPVTTTVELVTPLVGRVSTTLPASFHSVSAPLAAVGGDGRGGTGITFSMVLFAPVGAPTQVMTWTAQVENAELPPTEISVVPVTSRRAEIATARNGYSAGAQSAADLTVAASVIDANLINLAAGAGQLLDGLTQLAAGAAALQAGLADKAAPGAHQIADGLGTAKEGSTKLAEGSGKIADGLASAKDGSSKLADGSAKLAAGLDAASAGSEKLLDGSQALATGAGQAAAGADQLADGLALISGGLGQLAGTSGLPKALDGAVALRAGVERLRAGLGSASTAGTILNGMAQLGGGLTQLKTGIATAKGGVDQVKAGVDSSLAPGGSIDQLVAGLNSPTPIGTTPTLRYFINNLSALSACSTTPTTVVCQNVLGAGQVLTGIVAKIDPLTADSLRGKSKAASDGLGLISAGLGTGTGAAQAGIDALSAGVTRVTTGLNQIAAGLKSGSATSPGIAEGLDALVAGLTSAVAGVTALSTGATSAATGSAALADGTALVAAGAGRLSTEGAGPLAAGLGLLADGGALLADGNAALDAGVGQLADGSVTLAAGNAALDDGIGQLADGASQLAPGLDDAAVGAGKIAEGLEKTKAGAAKIGDGAGQLHELGTAVLAKKGTEAQATNAQKAAVLVAMGRKVDDGALPYGAPEGATGTAVYSFTLAGATTQVQDNTARGVVALALLGLASLSGWAIRRRIAG